MRNNKLYKSYKGRRDFTAKTVDGDYYPEIHTHTHTTQPELNFSRFY